MERELGWWKGNGEGMEREYGEGIEGGVEREWIGSKLRAIPEVPLGATNVGDVGDPNVGEFGDSNVVDQSDIGVEQNFPLLGELLELWRLPWEPLMCRAVYSTPEDTLPN